MEKFTPLPDKRYSIIYADPPWQYASERLTASDIDTRHYTTLSVDDLATLPVQDIAEKDCLLFLWMTGPKMPEAMKLGEAWGFKWVQMAFVWDKVKTLAGNYTMTQCEFVSVWKVGKIPQPRGRRDVRQLVQAIKTKHSEKPESVREGIDSMFPEQSKIELFARERVPGWDAWGNEV